MDEPIGWQEEAFVRGGPGLRYEDLAPLGESIRWWEAVCKRGGLFVQWPSPVPAFMLDRPKVNPRVTFIEDDNNGD